MRRAGIIVLAGALAAAVVAAAGGDDAVRVHDELFSSSALAGRLHYEIYLPTDYYSAPERRYPVVYFLHGLPSPPTAYRNAGFVEAALDRTGRDAILVAPQAARYDEPDPEYLDHSQGDRWETALAVELPKVIDGRYRTIASRRGRAIIGFSAGGFGAMHIGIAHLGEYAAVESWSGYFHPTDPTGTKALDYGPHNDVHRQLAATVSRIKRLHTLIAFYVGDGDSRFLAENRELNRELARDGIPHVFRVYHGGHEQSLWARHASAWLSLALTQLAPAR